VRSYAKYLKLHHARVIMNATVKRKTKIMKKSKSKSKKSFPDMSGDGKVTKKDILMARGVIKKSKMKKKK
jgi:hypothetical protein